MREKSFFAISVPQGLDKKPRGQTRGKSAMAGFGVHFRPTDLLSCFTFLCFYCAFPAVSAFAAGRQPAGFSMTSSRSFTTVPQMVTLSQEFGQDERRRAANGTSVVALPSKVSETNSPSSGRPERSGAGVSKEAVTPNNTDGNGIEGIGGKGGLVYDVNRLKRNLLQETMSAYKRELFPVLSRSAPTADADILEKLFALVQASPVRTTTDSNLLDGEDDWVLAYRSHYPTTVASLVLYDSDRNQNVNQNNKHGVAQYNARYNFLWKQTSETHFESTNWKERRAVVLNRIQDFFQTKHRKFRLEELEEDENAHVIDTISVLGGLFTKTKHYTVQALTRSSIELKQQSPTKWTVCGISKRQKVRGYDSADDGGDKNNDEVKPSFVKPNMTVSVIYLDTDLMILSECGGPDSPFYVYTRNRAYLTTYRTLRRKIKILQGAAKSLLVAPLNKLMTSSSLSESSKRSPSDPILKEIESAAARLRVLRLGDISGDGKDDESWESDMDPFVHLSADERQRLLKAMNVQQIQRAADTYRNSQKRFRWMQRLMFHRRQKTYFRKPVDSETDRKMKRHMGLAAWKSHGRRKL